MKQALPWAGYRIIDAYISLNV